MKKERSAIVGMTKGMQRMALVGAHKTIRAAEPSKFRFKR